MTIEERRDSKRVPLRVPVDYEHECNYLISYSRDISPDGIFVCTDTPLPVGSVVRLVFTVGDLHELTVTATVVWTPVPGSKGEPGMGLQFTDLPDSLREALLDIIHRVAVLAEEDEEAGPHGTA